MQTLATSKPLRYAYQNIKLSKRTLLIFYTLMLIGAAIFVTSFAGLCLQESARGNSIIPIGLASIGAGLFAASAVFMAFYAPIKNFSYLQSKSKTDMVMSLPITKKSRFLADYFSGLTEFIIPVIVISVLSAVGCTLSILGRVKDSFLTFEVYDNGIYRDSSSAFIGAMWKALFIGIIAAIFLYTTVAFVCQFSGTIADVLVFEAFILIMSTAASTMLASLLSNNVFCTDSYDDFNFIAFITNPLGCISYAFVSLAHSTYDYNYDYEMGTPVWCVVTGNIIFIALTFLMAFKLHQKRTAESVGTGISFRWVGNTIIAVTAFTFVALAALSSENIISLVFGAVIFIFYIIFTNRGKFKFKKIASDVVVYALSIAISIGFFSMVDITNTFGVGNLVPSASSVKSLELSIVDNIGEYNTVTFTDKEQIKKITSYQKQLIKNENEKESDINMLSGNTITFKYNLKSGFTKGRAYTYIINNSDDIAFRDYIVSTSEYAKDQAQTLKTSILNVALHWYVGDNSYSSYEYEEALSKSDIDEKDDFEVWYNYGKDTSLGTKTIKFKFDDLKKFADDLYNAALIDYANRKNIDTSKVDIYLSIKNNNIILESDENMIKVLNDYGIEKPNDETILNDYFDNNTTSTYYQYYDGEYDDSSYYINGEEVYDSATAVYIRDPEDYFTTSYSYVSNTYDEDIPSTKDNVYLLSESNFNKFKSEYTNDYKNLKSSSDSVSDLNVYVDETANVYIAYKYSDIVLKLYQYAEYKMPFEDTENEYYIMHFGESSTNLYIPKSETTQKLVEQLISVENSELSYTYDYLYSYSSYED